MFEEELKSLIAFLSYFSICANEFVSKSRPTRIPNITIHYLPIWKSFPPKKTSQELRMLSSVTLNCQVTMSHEFSFQLPNHICPATKKSNAFLGPTVVLGVLSAVSVLTWSATQLLQKVLIFLAVT